MNAVAELLTFRPVKVLERAGLEPQDLTGAVTASIKARFGLIKAQNPPAPIWDAKVALSDVDLKKPYAGRSITAVNGNLSVDNERLVLEAKAAVDTVPVEMKITEPVGAGSAVKRERVITATLSDDNRSKFAPGLDSIASGPVGIELTLQDDKTQSVSADLGKTTISVPWIGWTKSAGVPARATFVVDGQGKDLTIRDFSLTGDGFGASGQIALAGGSLSSATFANVRLSSADSYGLRITRGKSGYDIALDGKSADLRSVLKRVKSNGGTGSSGDKGTAIRLKASLDRVVGFNDESLRNVDLSYQAQGSRITGLDLSATTESGQAVIGTLDRSGDSNLMRLTSGDAGAIARFSDLYKRMQGGLLNLSFRNGSGDAWTGSIDVRNFRVANEKALQSIVSTPVGEKGRSLNAAVKRDIDVSSERFQRGFARLVSSSGVLSVENGVLRGEQVGATFKGILKDSDGNMDMTGTFMPAYGLNRLFAELPFIGVLLGNGRDRGLLGITFRLKGSMASPALTINPLSIIAPGIFRQIFEFQ